MKFSTDWREVIPPGEDARFTAFAEEFKALQASRDQRHGSGRALHRKPIGGVEARLDVAGDLPEVLRVGPFAEPRSFHAYVRFSNGSWERQSDAKPDVRGIAIKLLGVDGPKALTGADEPRTQDLLLIQSASTPFRNAEEFVALVRAGSAGSEAMLLPRLAWQLGPLAAFRMVRQLLGGLNRPFPSYGTSPFYTPVPMRWGTAAAKIALVPVSPTDGPTPVGSEGLGEELARRLKEGPLAWDLQVQLFQDEARTPIEDASVAWDPAVAPFTTIGRLEIPRVDVAEARAQRVSAYVEALAFDPWHSHELLRPLGDMNRARKAVYFASQQHRSAAAEPDGSESFDEAAATA